MRDNYGDCLLLVIAVCFLLIVAGCVGGPQGGSQQGALNVKATKVDKPTNTPTIADNKGPVKNSGNQGPSGGELVKMLLILMVWDTIRDLGKAGARAWMARRSAASNLIDRRLHVRHDKPDG